LPDGTEFIDFFSNSNDIWYILRSETSRIIILVYHKKSDNLIYPSSDYQSSVLRFI